MNNHFFYDRFDKMQLKFKNYKKYYGKICKKENDKNIIQKEQKLYYCYKCLNFYCLNKGKNIYAKKDRHKIIFNIFVLNIKKIIMLDTVNIIIKIIV